ncbi:hypothetical protein ACFY0N_21975 [Streptomyces vinaceus]|uniref:hypothetical protein n=1 Tax=Streptomyces vinaceus TaxID=1960 RepID=UPI003677756C
MKAVLVQFTVDVTVVATVTDRLTKKLGGTSTAVRETTLSQPVVIRMPEPAVRRMLAAQGDRVQDPGNHLAPSRPPPERQPADARISGRTAPAPACRSRRAATARVQPESE